MHSDEHAWEFVLQQLNLTTAHQEETGAEEVLDIQNPPDELKEACNVTYGIAFSNSIL
jgi:hypothetical protein